MAKSTIERVHNYRKRLKDDPVKYEAYKLKDKKRKQQARKKAKRIPVCTSDAARKRKLNRERVRRFRCRKKAEERRKNNAKPTEKKEEPGYKTPQALGKAVGRLKPVLPHSPRKRKAGS